MDGTGSSWRQIPAVERIDAMVILPATWRELELGYAWAAWSRIRDAYGQPLNDRKIRLTSDDVGYCAPQGAWITLTTDATLRIARALAVASVDAVGITLETRNYAYVLEYGRQPVSGGIFRSKLSAMDLHYVSLAAEMQSGNQLKLTFLGPFRKAVRWPSGSMKCQPYLL